ncbi:TRAP transporter small permease [Neptunomonas phycophila]|uniref:TRAP transporter small permease protein n=1 Tax=Neptunomonas phycophila TaxID=1572645 RepID=A0AAW7XGY7_9GAMM|nr:MULTISPECIES: TRAP transporter small permease [Neptunomonas]MBT3145165.1 TRAP transporter small permease [Neptunomonas phycophila]MDN2659291.1 TRAP transporter small permease [Neptunomonas sp. CHC150]MDO6453415.1 TRAP transporter small permease [Neptunomonas phycophila]MDO6468437.1 TRAP transporter small permease [Neptunomonas phycophila]MDO6784886.1 TRAP transporter small permease [Neptunomonas phycophila]
MLKKIIGQAEEAFISLLLVSMTLLVFVEVVARFGFNTGIHWSQELTLILAGWFVLFGASYGVKVGAHIGVDVFVKLLPKKAYRALTLLAIVLCLVYCGLFLAGSWVYVSKMYKIGIELEDIPLPRWMPMTVLLIGLVLLVIRFLQLGWKVITGEADGFHMADEAKESLELAKELQESDDAGELYSTNKGSK